MAYLKLDPRYIICDVCGGRLPNASEKAVARHEALEEHQHAASGNGSPYRHRDDTPHSAEGPTGCWICAEMRRTARESGATSKP